MTAFMWISVGVLASSTLWLLGILAGRDVYDLMRRRFPTDQQRHTLPPVRGDRWDATETEVMTLGDDLRAVVQPADWLEQAPLPQVVVVPVIPGPRPYRARHRAEDQLTTTQRFEAIAARAGAPVRQHGPRETSLAHAWVSAT